MKQILAGFLLWVVVVGTATAQQRRPESSNLGPMAAPRSATESPCDYDRCALRFTQGFGGWRLVQGATDKKIGDLGYFSGPDIEQLVRDVPEASEAARKFRSTYRVSSALLWGGGLIAATGVGFATANNGDHAAIGIGAAGLAIMAYGVYRHGQSFDLLSRSIWLYNRSLKR